MIAGRTITGRAIAGCAIAVRLTASGQAKAPLGRFAWTPIGAEGCHYGYSSEKGGFRQVPSLPKLAELPLFVQDGVLANHKNLTLTSQFCIRLLWAGLTPTPH